MRTSGHFTIADLDLEKLNESTSRRLVVGKNVMLQLVSVKAGSRPPGHSHPHEQLIWITSGLMKYRLGEGEARDCLPGSLVVIPGGVHHETWFPEDTDLVEIFSPIREDLLPRNRDPAERE
jgi:quercetin dioxygenase-like cupin family protein